CEVCPRPNRGSRGMGGSTSGRWVCENRRREAASGDTVVACIRKRRGKWVVDYRDGAGLRRWVTCDTRRDAEAVLDERRRESRQGTRPVIDPDVTLEAYAKRWLTIVKAMVKAATF